MITILGSSGFVGSHLVKRLNNLNAEIYTPDRNSDLKGKYLGTVIYCIGLTADFRNRPFETVEAHVSKLKEILEFSLFESLTYISSTRIYIHNSAEVNEESLLKIDTSDPFDLFNVSKLTGELLTLNCGKGKVKIVRPSNIYGNDFTSGNFITSIIKDALLSGKIILRTTGSSSKDYISIDSVTQLILEISLKGKKTIYNLASGVNTSNREILNVIQEETDCKVEYSANAEEIIFPKINIDRLSQEFTFHVPNTLLQDLRGMIDEFRLKLAKKDNGN